MRTNKISCRKRNVIVVHCVCFLLGNKGREWMASEQRLFSCLNTFVVGCVCLLSRCKRNVKITRGHLSANVHVYIHWHCCFSEEVSISNCFVLKTVSLKCVCVPQCLCFAQKELSGPSQEKRLLLFLLNA